MIQPNMQMSHLAYSLHLLIQNTENVWHVDYIISRKPQEKLPCYLIEKVLRAEYSHEILSYILKSNIIDSVTIFSIWLSERHSVSYTTAKKIYKYMFIPVSSEVKTVIQFIWRTFSSDNIKYMLLSIIYKLFIASHVSLYLIYTTEWLILTNGTFSYYNSILNISFRSFTFHLYSFSFSTFRRYLS